MEARAATYSVSRCLRRLYDIYVPFRGRFDRAAMFLHCEFVGNQYVRAVYEIKIAGTDFLLRSSTIDYYEMRFDTFFIIL